jgi:hypothetical protein
MIWYKHWLELHWRLLLAIAVSLISVVLLANRIDEQLAEYARTGQLAFAVKPYQPLLQITGPEPLFVWNEFANYLGTLLMYAPVVLVFGAGTSFKGQPVVHPSLYLTLSFPISRWRCMRARFVANGAMLILAGAFFTAATAVVLTYRGLPVPWGAMLLTGSIELVAAAPILAALEAFNLVCSTPALAMGGFALGLIPWLAFIVWTSHSSKNVVAFTDSPLPVVIVATVGTALAMALAAALIREKEY